MNGVRLAAAGLAVATVTVVIPMVWYHSAKAEGTPSTTSTPRISAPVSPTTEPTPAPTSSTAVQEEVDLVAIVDLGMSIPHYRNRAEAEELVAYLRANGVNAELRDKTVGESSFTFHVDGADPGAEHFDVLLEKYRWMTRWAAEPWSGPKLEAHNAAVAEYAAHLVGKGIPVEIKATEDGVEFPVETGSASLEDLKQEFLISKGRGKYDEDGLFWFIPTKAELDAERARTQELVDHLHSLGLEAGIEETEFGIRLVADLDDVDVLMAKEEFEWDETLDTNRPEAIEAYNRDTEALAAHLRKKGFEVEIKTNRYGLKYADHDRDETAEAVEEFWANHEFGS
ncbi:hypothetical protein EII34_13240 [Arachnia propionica]|uniref:Uncharacterized protein n=1 Tax=Arachnia propionica TaxID=1750 RepID=A0A3P1T552_9ACTN|nr:hypothetical protein [Arachnia propionica]RRD03553.1 hypothetical protein EII34_13240 [Arachnia propionica]